MNGKLAPGSKYIRAQIRKALTGRPDALTSMQLRQAANYKGKPAVFMGQLSGMKKLGEIIAYKGTTARSTRYSLNPETTPDVPASSSKPRAAKPKRTYTRHAKAAGSSRAIEAAIAELRARRDRIDAGIEALEALA